MAGLVFAHWNIVGFVDQDIRRLQQRVAQEAVGAEVFVFEFFLLVFVGGHAFQPTNRGAHGQQGEQLGVLGQAALQKNGALRGVQPSGEPVDDHFIDVLLDDAGVLVVGGQGVPVSDEVKALHLRLQAHPVFQGAVVVPQMQSAGGAHAR